MKITKGYTKGIDKLRTDSENFLALGLQGLLKIEIYHKYLNDFRAFLIENKKYLDEISQLEFEKYYEPRLSLWTREGERFTRVQEGSNEITRRIAYLDKVIERMGLQVTNGSYYVQANKPYQAKKILISILKEAQTGIIIVDNYFNPINLQLLEELYTEGYKPSLTILTADYKQPWLTKLSTDIPLLDKQYGSKTQLYSQKGSSVHDRFIIIDNKKVYHLGASLDGFGGNKASKITNVTEPKEIDQIIQDVQSWINAASKLV